MLSPARLIFLPEPDTRLAPHLGERGDTGSGPRRLVLLFGLLAALAAVAFPFAPVQQPDVTYHWSPADGTAAAIPLMPYQPVDLDATVSCAAVRAAGPAEQVLLSTVPLHADPAAEPLAGLRLSADSGALRASSAGANLGTFPVPPGDCTWSFVSDFHRSTLLLNGHPVFTRDGDLRPDVVGAFTAATDPTGVGLRLTADTRFQTTIGALKIVLAAVCVAGLLGMLAALRRADRRVRGPVRVVPRRWWRPRFVDVAVAAVLGLWWIIGPITVDDGYITGIVRSRGSSGFIGNVYRWLNAPEAPFSWFYDLYYAWAQFSPSTVWMRLPSTLLGLGCWLLFSRAVLPRLLPRAARRRGVGWLAAVAFAAWWLPFNLGLRPEPWVAVGSLAVFVAVERAIAARALLPLVVGLLTAGVTTALTPGGLMAFMPFVAGAVPVLRLLRARRDLGRLPLLVALLSAPAAALLLMFVDQSLAGVLEATRVRTLIGGGSPWYEEYQRYALLLQPDYFQGTVGKRAPVLLGLLAAAGVLWAVGRRSLTGIPRGPARRLTIGFLLALATMTASPTKWTQHFGDVAGLGAAVLLLALLAWSRQALRARSRGTVERPLIAGLGALTLVGALVLAGYNNWPYVSNFYNLTWSTVAPLIAGVPVTVLWLAAGGLLVAGLLARSAWLRSAPGTGMPSAPKRVPAPATVALVLVVGVLGLQVLSFARVSVAQQDGYTLAADAVDALHGDPCGLEPYLSVETDPAAGLLPALPTPGPTLATVPADVGGRPMAGLSADRTGSTAWFALDPAQRAGELPVVVTVSGTLQPGDTIRAEFNDDAGRVLSDPNVPAPSTPTPTDVRLPAPERASVVRLVVDTATGVDTGPAPTAVVTLPRVPRLTPMSRVLPAGSQAILDWPVAFQFPCLQPAPLANGTAPLPRWRVGPPQADSSATITYSPVHGGPFAAPRMLVTEQRMATYWRGDPMRDAAQLYRWVPTGPLATLQPVVTTQNVAGWHADGRTRVPGLDPVG